MLMFFSLTFICWGASAVDVYSNDEADLERPLWSQYDPHLIGELVFAVANLLAIIRLLFFFQITQAIGPLQVSYLRKRNTSLVLLGTGTGTCKKVLVAKTKISAVSDTLGRISEV